MESLRIDGQRVPGEGPELRSFSPIDEAPVWEGCAASSNQVQTAVRAARRAANTWAEREAAAREAIVEAYAAELTAGKDELAALISRETGKPRWECEGEVATCIAKVEVSIRAARERRPPVVTQAAGAQAHIEHRALGVVLVLGPFNFPAHLPGGQMIPALLAGNSVVFKPSELTPAVGQWIVDAWERAGIPPGTVNLIQGGRPVAEAAIDQTAIDAVMFTGSHAAGQAIHRRLAGRTGVLLALEMGGNNPLVVLPTEAPEQTAGAAVASAYITAGQRCTCARRLIVLDDARGAELVEALGARIGKLRVGLPQDSPQPFIGPLISAAAAEQLLQTQRELVTLGGRPLVELRADPRCPALLHPGLIEMTDVPSPPDREHFGPLLQVYRAADLQHAIELANQTRFGLAAALLGGSEQDFTRFRRGVRAGVVNWNRPTTGASGALPFGGIGDSGNHRPAGFWMVDACSDPVASLVSPELRDDSFDRMQF